MTPATAERERCYAWVLISDGLTVPDRSYVLRRLVRGRAGAPVPEQRSFMSEVAEEDDGGRRAELIFWYGAPENVDRGAAKELGVEILTTGTGDWPELPVGWSRRGRR